jgi:hypothetical protein
MDIDALRTAAIEATTQSFLDKQGFAPDQDSEEWEEEYRRQFARAKARHAAGKAPPAASAAAAPEAEEVYPELHGAPAQMRWGASLRSERLRQIRDAGLREFLASEWRAAKDWVETRELPAASFQRRAEAQHAQHRRAAEERERAVAAERQAKAAAAAAATERLRAAGITAAGLVELVDLSPRVKPATIAAKLAELGGAERRLRVFETTDPGTLLVLESGAAGRSEYGIERDEGLVRDLKLFGEAATP